MFNRPTRARWLRVAGAMMLCGIALACTPNRPAATAPVDIRGTDPSAAHTAAVPTTPADPVADANGIVTYDGYQTVRARGGDTVITVSERIGMSATQLGAYNGLPADHKLRAGDELALPPRPGGYGQDAERGVVTAPANPTVAEGPPATAGVPVTDAGVPAGVEVPAEGVAAAPTPTTPVETAWSPELAEAAIARSSGINANGSLGPPPSSATPIPTAPPERPQLESPELSQYQTEDSQGAVPPPPPAETPAPAQVAAADTAPALRLRRPVEGPVAIGFNKGSGPARNDGVDFAAPAGAKVVAAADGEVALVSESLSGLGTIILVRHPNEILTVYGRVDRVMVQKGDLVSAGQQIGVVSDATAPAEPRMHFEVRRGAESLDPMLFL